MVAAVALFAAVSCNKELPQEETGVPSGNAITFIANVDNGDQESDPAVKSVMGDGISLWDGTEKIWILDPQSSTDDNGEVYYNTSWKKGFTASANKQASVTFVEDDENLDFAGTSYMALYPASPCSGATWEGEDASIAGMWLKNEQDAVAGSYDPEAHVAIAEASSSDDVLSFKNVVALLKFQVDAPAVHHVKFISYGAEGVEAPKIAGNFSVAYNNGDPLATIETGENKYSTNEVVLKGQMVAGTDYYMAILPANFTEGFGVEVNGYKLKQITGEQAKNDYASMMDRKRSSVLNLKTLSLEFGICGTLNDWEADLPMTYDAEVGMYVAEDVVFDKGKNEFKIRVNSAWLTSVGTGGEVTLDAENTAYINGANSSIADGTYDIWFDADDKIVYALTSGKKPGDIYTHTVYLKPNSNWVQGDARFAAYFYRDGEAWVDMTDDDNDGIYECEVPSGVSRIIFCRMNPNVVENRWNEDSDTDESKPLWNQSANLQLPVDDNNCYTIAEGAWSNGDGSWSTLEDAKNPEGEVGTPTTIYLVPGGWAGDGAWFAVAYDGSAYKMERDEEGYYKYTIPGSVDSFSFWRMNPSSEELAESNRWNEIPINKVPSVDKNYFVWSGWDAPYGNWEAKPIRIFGIVGEFDWNNDISMEKVAPGIYAAKNVTEIEPFTDWKIRVNGDWKESYTSTITGIEANKWVAVGGSGNTTHAVDGAIDIYLDLKNARIYVMSAGTDYSTAVQQTVSTTPPPVGVPVEANHIYLRPGNNWPDAGATFAVWIWKDNGQGKVYKMTKHATVDGVYEVEIASDVNKIIFIRVQPGVNVVDGTASFPNKWDQTGTLTFDGNLYTVVGWQEAGTGWSTVEVL